MYIYTYIYIYIYIYINPILMHVIVKIYQKSVLNSNIFFGLYSFGTACV